jgi:hypothetical protein
LARIEAANGRQVLWCTVWLAVITQINLEQVLSTSGDMGWHNKCRIKANMPIAVHTVLMASCC